MKGGVYRMLTNKQDSNLYHQPAYNAVTCLLVHCSVTILINISLNYPYL